jgi:hypothetical protein
MSTLISCQKQSGLVVSSTRSKYIKLGLKILSLGDNHSLTPNKLSMVEEKKNVREEDSINLFLEQALMQQRDEMMYNFSTFFNVYR